MLVGLVLALPRLCQPCWSGTSVPLPGFGSDGLKLTELVALEVSNHTPLTPSALAHPSGRERFPSQCAFVISPRRAKPVPNSLSILVWSTCTQMVRDSADEIYPVATCCSAATCATVLMPNPARSDRTW